MRRATGAAAIPRPAGGGRGRAGGGGPARVVLAAPAGNPAEALGRRLGAAVVTDPGAGPLAALAAALAALRSPHVLALAADHPCLQVGLLARLLAEREARQAGACRPGGRVGAPGGGLEAGP